MKHRVRREDSSRGRRLAVRTAVAFTAVMAVAAGSVHAITVSKLNIKNTGAASTNQRVKIYGLPPLVLDSPPSGFTTEVYTNNTSAPYPYATSTNSQAIFRLTTGSIGTNEYASATVSTVDPAAALSISDWAWYGGATGNTRLGAVPDPSLSVQEGPSGLGPDGILDPGDWVSANLTFTNTVKPSDGVVALTRPSAALSYMDFGVGAYRCSRPRGQQIAIEQHYSQEAIKKINPNSSGQLAQAFDLLHNSSGFLNPGESAADDGNYSTRFVPPVVLLPGQPAPVPGPAQAATAHFVSATTGSDGVNPVSTMNIQSANRILNRVTLGPGASITFQVRVVAGAIEIPDDMRPLFIGRMREVNVVNSVETSEAVFSGVADYPRCLHVGQAPAPGGGGGGVPAPVAPRDRQEWAHLLRLYNRSLRLYQHAGDAALRTGRF